MIHHWYGMFIVMELCFCFRNLKRNEKYTLMTCVDGVISNKSRSTRIPLWNAYRMIIRADRFRVALYLLPQTRMTAATPQTRITAITLHIVLYNCQSSLNPTETSIPLCSLRLLLSSSPIFHEHAHHIHKQNVRR